MTLIFVSDLHLDGGAARPEIAALVAEPSVQDADVLVLGGDVADPWKAPWDTILQSADWRRIQDMVGGRCDRGLQTLWIDRNHDYNPPPEALPQAKRAPEYRAGNWLFLHGWEFDPLWSFGPFGVHEAAFWLARNHPALMCPIYKALYRHKTPGTRPRVSRTLRDDWTLGIGLGHDRARMYAKHHGLNLVIGHFHCPQKFDGLIADAGDMVDSFTYFELNGDKGKVRQLCVP